MTRIALHNLAARKMRTALTAIAIVLGVSMVSGSFVLTDTISKAFESIFTSAYRDTDAVVTGRKLVDWSSSGNATVPESLLRSIRSHEDVADATGSIVDIGGDSTKANVIGRDGKPIDNGSPTFGFGMDPRRPRFNPMAIRDGRWASGPDEVVLDADTAENQGFRLGDRVGVSANGPARSFRLVGTAGFGDVASLGGATVAVWDVPTARAMLGIDGYTTISVAAKDGVSADELVRALESVVPASTEVRSGAEQAAEDKASIETFISFIPGLLLAFGGVALLVGAFVIFNSLSITVAQRTRELGTMRTLGASRRQVRRVVLVEAVLLGALASAVGIAVGIGLARGLSALAGALDLELPEATPVYATRTFLISFAVGVGVTALAGIVPARRATRIAPIAAVQEGAATHARRPLGTVVAALALGVGVLLVQYAVRGGHIGEGSHLLALAGGTLLVLGGVAGVASVLVGALVRVVGVPVRRLGGVAGSLASENAARSPARTASTAAALMIGLALVTFVAVLGSGVRGSYRDALASQFDVDYVVTSQNGWSAFPRAAGEALRGVPGVRAVSSVRTDRGLVGTAQATVNGVDPATLEGLYRFSWSDGSSDEALRSLGRDGAILKRAFARDNGLEVGEAFTLRSADGSPLRLVVRGLYAPPRLAEVTGGVIVSQETFDGTFARPQNAFTLVRGTVDADRLEQAVSAFPDARVQTLDGYVTSQASFIDSLVNMLLVLLGLSVVVSLFGMVNTLVLAVFERTREIGMLRAVGLTRRQTRRMVRHESVITALVGAALGLPLGVALAYAVTHSLKPYGVAFVLPLGWVAAFTVVAVVAGMVAALAPARRAARLDVLTALQYQ